MNSFTIKDIESLSGIKAHTIRIWEQRYNFLNPQRTGTNIRYYSSDELKTILNISLLNKYGFKISHINTMSAGEISDKILTLSQAQAQQERVINDLIQHMIDVNIDMFESVLNNYILLRGIEKTITFIIFPFLERIGVLWLTNRVNPGQEHLVTNIIRQKIIVGIESTVSHLRSSKTALLFLPEGEHHELGLLFMHYILKTRGLRVLYLGANAPNADIEYVNKLKKPDFIYTHLTAVGNNFNFEKFLAKINFRIPTTPIVISGLLTQTYKKQLPGNIYLKRSLSEVLEYVSSLSS